MEVRESKKRKKKKRMEFRLRPEGFLSMTEKKKKNQYTSEDPPPPFSSLSSLVIQFRLHPAFGPPPPYHPSSTSAISFFPDDSGDPFLFLFFLLETKKKHGVSIIQDVGSKIKSRKSWLPSTWRVFLVTTVERIISVSIMNSTITSNSH